MQAQHTKESRWSHCFIQWGWVFAMMIVVVMAAVAAWTARIQAQHTDQLAQRVQAENRLKMESTLEHVQEYFQNIYSTLIFVALDDEVEAMTKESHNYIQSIFNHQQNLNHLSELYVVERHFEGTEPPFMTFKAEMEEQGNEEDEYRILMEQIAHFAALPDLRAQISEEVFLCRQDSNNCAERGLVYSVPIHQEKTLVGVVAGMIATRHIAEVLERGNFNNMAVLVSEKGTIFGCEDLPSEIREWFAEQFRQKSAAGFFAAAPEIFAVDKWKSQWTPVTVPSEQRWWLVFQYDEQALLALASSDSYVRGWLAGAGILSTGIVLALLVLAMRHQLKEQTRHNVELRRAEAQIKSSLHEKETLLKETNHRVKNNLQVVASLLDLQARRIEDSKVIEIFQDSRNRVTSMSLIHERLYRSRDLASINIKEYIQNLALEVFASYRVQTDTVELKVHVDDVPMDADTAINCGLIINELVSNSLKYAFLDGQKGEISIDLHQEEDGQAVLVVRDDGVGLPPTVDYHHSQSLGLQLVTTLVKQLQGRMEMGREKGTTVRITFSFSV